MKQLTRAEEEVMHAVWSRPAATLGQVREALAAAGSTAKPTTIATVLKILAEKGFVRLDRIGRSYTYSPAVAKTDYSAGRLRSFIERFFGGNPAKLVSFLAEREDLDLNQIEALLADDQDEEPPTTEAL